MSTGNIKTQIEIGKDIYNVDVSIPSDEKQPYVFQVADQNISLIGLAISKGEQDQQDPQKKAPDNVYLTVSPPPSILPNMIKSLSVNFFNGKYTAMDNPLILKNTPSFNEQDKLKLIEYMTNDLNNL